MIWLKQHWLWIAGALLVVWILKPGWLKQAQGPSGGTLGGPTGNMDNTRMI